MALSAFGLLAVEEERNRRRRKIKDDPLRVFQGKFRKPHLKPW